MANRDIALMAHLMRRAGFGALTRNSKQGLPRGIRLKLSRHWCTNFRLTTLYLAMSPALAGGLADRTEQAVDRYGRFGTLFLPGAFVPLIKGDG